MWYHKIKYLSLTWLVSLVTLLWVCTACQNEGNSGPKAPDFSLKNLSGQTVTLKQHRGNVVVLDFWASWCPPCRSAIPELIKLQNKYQEMGVIVLGISMDDPRKVDNAYLRTFCEKFKTNYKILRYDYNVLESYFGTATPLLPTLYVIDQKGHVRDKFVGMDSVALEKSIKGLIG